VESLRGLVQLGFSYPVGMLSDASWMSRVRLVKLAMPVWTIGYLMCLFGVVQDQLAAIVAGIAVWAIGSQVWTGTSQVLVADFSQPDQRTKNMANLSSTRMIASSTGNALQILFLFAMGQDHWSNNLLRTAILTGVLLWPGVVYGIMCRLRDLEPLEKVRGGRKRAANATLAEEDLERRAWCGVRVRWLLAINLEFVSFITKIGAGMTVKFFPLFFRVDYNFTPMQVCMVMAGAPLCTSAMMQVCRKVSERTGRMHALLIFQFLGTACLWSMCYIRSILLVLPMFLLRGALMNARNPIMRAMVMDLVPVDRRGRWNSIQSMSSVTWSGSAALGGWIADWSGDYRFTFNVTAMIYTGSFLCMLPCLLIYPAERRTESVQADPPAPAAVTAADGSSGPLGIAAADSGALAAGLLAAARDGDAAGPAAPGRGGNLSSC